MFNPPFKYDVVFRRFNLEDFSKYSEDFVVRPPYQRKSVWSKRKKLALLDSLFRRYYVPRIVVREVKLHEKEVLKEIVDGQQRITVAQQFYRDELRLPKSLNDLDSSLPGKRYSELPVGVRRFVDKELGYEADMVRRIDDPTNPEHQKIAAEIFWRLQQGESLNYMEIAHAQLSSLPRNFVVKYADDQTFDYEAYRPVDENKSKHKFFDVIDRRNDRMQHLALLTRFLILEVADGPADIKDTNITDFIDKGQDPDGIGNQSYEKTSTAKAVLSTMNHFYRVFARDPMVTKGSGMKEFRTEYFVISLYLLLRHLRDHYVVDDKLESLFQKFTIDFHDRWKARREDDNQVLVFSDHRQQTSNDIAMRQRILRQLFFEYADEQEFEIIAKDTKRAFSEADRIRIYRRDEGRCQECLRNGMSEDEAIVPWDEYEADHVIPHARGGSTTIENAEVLCRAHNRVKGASLPP